MNEAELKILNEHIAEIELRLAEHPDMPRHLLVLKALRFLKACSEQVPVDYTPRTITPLYRRPAGFEGVGK